MENSKYILNFNKVLILLFMLLVGSKASGQATLSLRYLATDNKYHVYLTPTAALGAVINPKLTDGSSQITLLASTGGNLNIGTVTSVNPAGSWSLSTTAVNNGDASSGAPTGKDFFVITPAGDFTSINYTSGTEVELFNFDVTGTCTGSLDILPAGSQTAAGGTLNISSYYSVKGYTGGIGTNHFSSTYNMNATCPVSAAPDLITTIGQPTTPFTAGQPSNVPVTITNIGSGPATGPIATTFTLPTGTSAPASFTSGTSTCTTAGQTVSCSTPGPISNTAPSNTAVINVPVTPAPSTVGTTPGPFTATTTAPNEPVANTGNNPATPMTPTTAVAGVPDLTTTIGQPTTPFTAGQPSNVPVTITNIGTGPATGPIATTFTLPTGTSAPASFTSGTSTCTTAGQTVSCSTPGPISNTAPSNTAVINVPVTPAPSTVGTTPGPFTATTTGPNEPIGNTANNPATPMTPTTPVAPGNTLVMVRALLQGGYQSAGLMRDQLRTKNLIPSTEPYTALGYIHKGGGGGETVSSTVLANSDINNAIVDWVIVELRDAATPSLVIASKSALIQKDGDVVSAVDGLSAVTFTGISPTNYYVAVKHRNHLGVMSKTALNFGITVGLIDFTISTTLTNGTNPMKVLTDGKLALWAGNTTGDNKVIYSGGSNDVDPIFAYIVNDAANLPAKATSFVKTAYTRNDVNLTGTVVYQGPSNDVDIIFANILSHPLNLVSKSASFVIFEQIP